MSDDPNAQKPRPLGVIAIESNRLAVEADKRNALGLPADDPSPFNGFRSAGVDPVRFASGFRSGEARGFYASMADVNGVRSFADPDDADRSAIPKNNLPNTLTYKMQQQEERVRHDALEMQRATRLESFSPGVMPAKRRKSKRRMTLERAALWATIIAVPLAVVAIVVSLFF